MTIEPTYPVEEGKLVFPQGTSAEERIRASRAKFVVDRKPPADRT